MICDLPNKLGTSIAFNLVLYFMTNLRRTPGHFLVFLLFTLTCTLTMSMYIRSIAALSRTFPQASHLRRAQPGKADPIVGYGSDLDFHIVFSDLHRVYYSRKRDASLVPLDQLPQSRCVYF